MRAFTVFFVAPQQTVSDTEETPRLSICHFHFRILGIVVSVEITSRRQFLFLLLSRRSVLSFYLICMNKYLVCFSSILHGVVLHVLVESTRSAQNKGISFLFQPCFRVNSVSTRVSVFLLGSYFFSFVQKFRKWRETISVHILFIYSYFTLFLVSSVRPCTVFYKAHRIIRSLFGFVVVVVLTVMFPLWG